MAIQLISMALVIFAGVYLLLVGYMCRGWRALPSFSRRGKKPTTKVSVLIAARNEEVNIGRTLSDILAQDFPKELLEIIVVDDHSTDGTSAIVQSLSGQGVKLLTLNESEPLNSYKKKAISMAIAEATGQLMITTDADCRMGSDWLTTVVTCMEQYDYFLLSAPVVYSQQRSFFEELQTLEFLYLIGLGAAGIGNRYPSTCNGANLIYRRDVFYEMGGFNGIDHLASGDDELFLHKVAASYPNKIGFCKSRDAIVYTDAKRNLRGFINQRRRWASKSTHYKNRGIVALGISIWFFNVLLLISGIAAFTCYQVLWPVFAVAISLKFLIEFIFLYPLCRFAKRMELLVYLPVLTVVHVLYMVYIGIAGNIGKYQWKGRRVN
ncbi:glycosyltransferase family 2 protein [Parapedobacter indicus]|uniref:Glycosyltransferase, catalytic subunit of cellulose synthase and poly-beta-1,6-N-acetylglucosamine synthase n=1 Tax=Parapedobacter indicus TaxID=1477437 RepID=A0A1I3NJM7_9SPHI|nr:glycosyltransferase [Parapedobacter indicus]PPL00999.1 cellulose synthase/poly-beta-1,6-N-acetylglucosamine synthase-like glycosyltransferase [Parapedobacter indicus]SFJ09160.1 Glycosyltransferase, catalytic subunit of cellulose synthase and poly-beta-1,6-N-acetylglucosamine synthase [Parapedobacter indicus]